MPRVSKVASKVYVVST